ncbi:MAG: hypothetical protein VX252_12480 [Myxococcota bacterium]|nr:hypothetical protein [Myxococcota bacterium]
MDDSRGLSVRGADAESIAAVDSFREGLLAMEGGLDGIVDAAERAPGCALLQVYAALFFLYAGTREGNAEAARWLHRAAPVMQGVSGREGQFFSAGKLWIDDDLEGAMQGLEQITSEYPRDLVAAKTCEFLYYLTGQHRAGPRYRAQMERLVPHNQDEAEVFGMYAFSLELDGEYEEARRQADRALTLRYESAWTHHALAHAALVTDDLVRGRREQESFLASWTHPPFSIHGHNAWHLALLRLLDGDHEGALELFRDVIWGQTPESCSEQVDAISLLWRMEMAGLEVEESIWSEVGEACASLSGEAMNPFVTAHHAHALARVGRDEDVTRLRQAVEHSAKEQPKARRAVWEQAGIPVVDAAIAWGRRDAPGVVECLEPAIREVPRVGGSDAQDDLFRLALLRALEKMWRTESMRALLDLFPGTRKPNSQFI